MTQIADQDRRRFISKLKSILGASVAIGVMSSAGISSALAFERSLTEPSRDYKLFNAQEMATLSSVVQTIIPKTDTPGAADVDCHGFIDHQLVAVHTQDEQRRIKDLLVHIESVAQQKYQAGFNILLPEQQVECLTNIELGKWSNKDLVNSFKFLKSLNTFGYFTSEIGATQVLNYQAVPGGYKIITMTDKTTNHGLLAFY